MKLFFGTALALTVLSAFQSAAVPEPLADFRDLAAAAGLNARTVIGGERTKQFILETTGGGVAIVDYDDDGWPDIFLVNGARRSLSAADAAPVSHLYRNNHDGTFADVTEKAGVAGKGWGQGVCAGDYDNDGHIDLFVTYYGHQVLYRNNGDGTFNDVTRGSGLSLSKPRWNTGCAFLDFNRDGRLDLLVSAYVDYADATRYAPGSRDNCFWKGLGVMCGPHGLAGSSNALYRGNPDGTFTNVSEEAGLLKPRPAYGLTPLVLDYDNDGWPDVYVANDSSPSLLFHNNGNGTFKEVGLQAGVALNADGRAQAGMGVGAGDYNRDGWLDIVKTNFDDATVAGGLGVNTAYLGWGTGFIDFDLDSWPDIFIVNGHVYPEADRIGGRYGYEQPKILYRNLGNGRFEDVSKRAGPGVAAKKAARGAAFGDLFNSGRQDVVVNNMNDSPTLLHDCAPSAGHSLVVQLIGTRSNRSAIGARVTVQLAGRRLIDEVRSGGSFCSQSDLRIHTGLGVRTRADRIEVAWPSGTADAVAAIDADQLVVIREGSGVVRREPLVRRALAACGQH
ncbi:MAG: RNA-binding protein [Acidobacteria bacterium]|nr:MAG: RNA-binding protein [Acidobacteriota bacterium]